MTNDKLPERVYLHPTSAEYHLNRWPLEPSEYTKYVRTDLAGAGAASSVRELLDRFLWDKYGCTIEHHRMKVLKHFVEWAEIQPAPPSACPEPNSDSLQATHSAAGDVDA